MKDSSKNYKVYKHTFPNKKVYIGITSQNPKQRWANGKGYMQNRRMYRNILKYGWENIEHEILFDGLTQEEAFEKEIELITKYNSTDFAKGYNIHTGGALDFETEVQFDYDDMLIPYERIKNNPFQKLLLLKLFQLAIGFKYKDRIDIEATKNGIVVFRDVKYINNEVKPDTELGEMLYKYYKDEAELKAYIDKVKQILLKGDS